MSLPVLATKLYIPPPRSKIVLRPRLIERLNEGLLCKLTLISAPAGFGKTTLASEWLAGCGRPAAWLTLDEGDNDPARFMLYLVAALQTVAARQSSAASLGAGVLQALQSPQTPPGDAILTALLNDINALPLEFVLVLDDYHVIDAKPVDHTVAFLLEHLPQQMHLVLATREDPNLPLARLRAGSQLSELRAADLAFTHSESAGFLNQVMGLNLSEGDVAALGTRTEGWIAGLQLAGLALQGLALQGLARQGALSTPGGKDAAIFIKSFTGSHHFVMDYLIEEVLSQQPESVQAFLLHTCILDRLCGPLCDAILGWDAKSQPTPSVSGQGTLEYLVRANLFIVPLDDERRWYRYHHLFADLLRQRLQHSANPSPAELHQRASAWYEDNGLEIEAFRHAVIANDVERAARLVEGKSMPLQFRGAVMPVLNWLASLPKATLDGRPSLWVMYASALSMTGQLAGVEEKLQAAEDALQGLEMDAKNRNLIGHIAAIRALLAAMHNQVEAIVAQSQRALEYLHPDNLFVRTATIWKLGIAYQFQGERAAASQAYSEAMAKSQATGNIMIHISAAIGLGNIQKVQNQLRQAVETYRHALQLAGDPPPLSSCLAYLGLAHIFYEWNDLEAAREHTQKCLEMARQIDFSDTCADCEVFFVRVSLAQGDAASAALHLAQTRQVMQEHHFEQAKGEFVALQVLALLRQGNLESAIHLVEEHDLPLSRARVLLAQENPSAALAALGPYLHRVEARGWEDERLKTLVLQALALHALGEKKEARQVLSEALGLAEPDGFVRTFIDEGPAMAQLLSEAATHGMRPDYTTKLLAACEEDERRRMEPSSPSAEQPLVVPLSQRELEVLRLIAQGLSNREIGERLFLALSTVKGHSRIIFDKLQVRRRTEAVAQARALGLLQPER